MTFTEFLRLSISKKPTLTGRETSILQKNKNIIGIKKAYAGANNKNPEFLSPCLLSKLQDWYESFCCRAIIREALKARIK